VQIPVRGLQVHERVLGRVLEARGQGAPPQHRRLQGGVGQSVCYLQGKHLGEFRWFYSDLPSISSTLNVQIFCTNVILSSYIWLGAKNSYEKRAPKTLMKLTHKFLSKLKVVCYILVTKLSLISRNVNFNQFETINKNIFSVILY
jgi:hypothetical protein